MTATRLKKKLSSDFISILEDYANNYESLDDKKADVLVTKMSANNIAYENLYSKYYKQMKPVVGALKSKPVPATGSLSQNSIKTAILDEIPFIGEIDRSKVKDALKQ